MVFITLQRDGEGFFELRLQLHKISNGSDKELVMQVPRMTI